VLVLDLLGFCAEKRADLLGNYLVPLVKTLQDELTKSFQVELNDTLQPPEARGKVTIEVTFAGG